MPYVGFVQHTTPQMNATAEFPTLTASEESNLILQDVFECDQDGMNAVLEASLLIKESQWIGISMVTRWMI